MARGPAVDLADALSRAEAALTAAGVGSPRSDAVALAAHVLDIDRAALARLLVLQSHLDPNQVQRYAEVVSRRADREPLQHIVGRAPFRRIELRVGPGVFVPRPETELVAGAVVDRLVAGEGAAAPVVVDLCAGSGAIGLSVADEVPGAVVHLVELSDDAVLWLGRNVEESRHGARVHLHHVDAARCLPELDGTVDVVVSNPPYVPVGASIRDPEVSVHDPAAALWGGPDGLDVVREVAATAARLLRPGGLLVIEHGDLQGEAVPALLLAQPGRAPTDAPWTDVVDHPDLAGRPRFTTARRTPLSR